MRANKASTSARRAAGRAAPSDRERLRGAVPPELGATDHFIALILEAQSFDHMLWLFAGIEQSVSGLPPRLASSRVVISLPNRALGRYCRRRHRCHQRHLVDALLPELVPDLHRTRRHRDLCPRGLWFPYRTNS
jgi:hypothetical protein